MALEITPTDATLGATVCGVDLNQLDDAIFDDIEAAWHEYAVLIFPEQHLDDEGHLAFSRRFGNLEQSIKRTRTTGISNLSNVQADGSVAPRSSLQARFLIPMAITIVFGLALATLLVLVLIPALVGIQEDVKRLMRRRASAAVAAAE